MNLLLCEDDSSVGHFVQRGLRMEGHTIDWVQRGSEGLNLAYSRHYHSVILDLMLPDLDGLEICRQLRKANNPVPVLMLTVRDSLEEKLEGFEAGADDYLTKPFAFKELAIRLKALKRRGRNLDEDTDISTYGAIRLDRNTRQLSCDEQPVDLTEREFQLLECLLDQAGKAVPRERIIQRVWGLDANISDNAVDVYVGYLRKKLHRQCRHQCIHTVRGIGFKLEFRQQ